MLNNQRLNWLTEKNVSSILPRKIVKTDSWSRDKEEWGGRDRTGLADSRDMSRDMLGERVWRGRAAEASLTAGMCRGKRVQIRDTLLVTVWRSPRKARRKGNRGREERNSFPVLALFIPSETVLLPLFRLFKIKAWHLKKYVFLSWSELDVKTWYYSLWYPRWLRSYPGYLSFISGQWKEVEVCRPSSYSVYAL